MMGMFKCKEFEGDECKALSEISSNFGLAYQWLNDIENIVGVEQEEFSDLFNNHPNALLIRITNTRKQRERSGAKGRGARARPRRARAPPLLDIPTMTLCTTPCPRLASCHSQRRYFTQR